MESQELAANVESAEKVSSFVDWKCRNDQCITGPPCLSFVSPANSPAPHTALCSSDLSWAASGKKVTHEGLYYQSGKAAVTKYQGVGGLNKTCISLQFWSLEVQDQGVGRVGFILRHLSFACRWPSSPLSSHGLSSVSVYVLISS